MGRFYPRVPAEKILDDVEGFVKNIDIRTTRQYELVLDRIISAEKKIEQNLEYELRIGNISEREYLRRAFEPSQSKYYSLKKEVPKYANKKRVCNSYR